MNTVSTPKPLVKSECCKAKMYTVGNTTHHWRCDNCGQPCNPSETNEADYLKEFDELFGVSKDDDLITTTRYCLHNFLKSSIERARQDERQRVVEMIEGMIKPGGYEKYCGCDGECFADCNASYNQALSDLQSKLEKV